MKKLIILTIILLSTGLLFSKRNQQFYEQYRRFRRVFVKLAPSVNINKRYKEVRISYRLWKGISIFNNIVYSYFQKLPKKSLVGRDAKLYKVFKDFRKVFQEDYLYVREDKRLYRTYISMRMWKSLKKFKSAIVKYFKKEDLEYYKFYKKPRKKKSF